MNVIGDQRRIFGASDYTAVVDVLDPVVPGVLVRRW